MKLKLSTISLGVVLLLTCVGPAFAQTSLYITNNSFEYPASSAQHIYITGGSPGTSGYMAGWTTVATQAGYWDTRNTNGSLSGVTNVDGAQVLEVYNVGSGAAGYIYQELTNKWVAGATYTMTARAGQPNPPGNPANVGDTFSLDANNSGTLSQLSSTTISTNGGQEGLLNYTVTYTATGSEPGDGHIVVAFHVPTTTSTGGMWIDDFALNVVLPDPSVVTQPISQTNVSGSTVSFSVNVYGASQLSYQWQATNSATGGFTNLVNGGVFSGATTNVLTLAGITTNQSLTYRVVATDTAGSVTSAPATLTVLTIPIINAEPVSQTVVSGSTVAYTVSASGVGTLNYQWQATNSAAGGFTNIVGATTNVLTLASVTTNSALSYQVIVANANGSVTSAPPATLTVLPSTTLVDVQFDGSYNLSTSTSGLGPVQTGAAILGATGDEWNVETVPYYVTSASLISGGSLTNTIGTASGLTLTVTQPNGNPVYTATYNNKVVDPNTTNLMSSALESFNYYASSQTFNISIGGLSAYTNSPFTLVIYAADPNSPVTETLAITNGATGGNTASALTTSSASGSLTNSPGGVGVSYNTFVGTITNGTLSFTVSGGVADGHTGVNGFQLLLSPSVAPIITTEPASQTNIAGSTAVFSVVAAGGGALTYQWQATNSATGGFTNVVNGGQISGATSNTLAISNLSTNWALAYQVVVSSGGFSITSTPAAYLTVPWTNIYVVPGGSIQVAINQAYANGGGQVNLAPGTYYGNIVMYPGVTLNGSGPNTIIAASTISGSQNNPASGYTVQNLVVDGQISCSYFSIGATNVPGLASVSGLTGLPGINGGNPSGSPASYNLTYRNVEVKNTSIGMQCWSVYGLVITNCNFHDDGIGFSHNIYLVGCPGFKFVNCISAWSRTGDGLHLDFASNGGFTNSFIQSEFDGEWSLGILDQAWNGSANYTKLKGCGIKYGGQGGGDGSGIDIDYTGDLQTSRFEYNNGNGATIRGSTALLYDSFNGNTSAPYFSYAAASNNLVGGTGANVYHATLANGVNGPNNTADWVTTYGGQIEGAVDFNANHSLNGSLTWPNVSSTSAGTRQLSLVYANGTSTNVTMQMIINGGVTNTLTFPSTGGWSTYSAISSNVTLTAANNTVQMLISNPGATCPILSALVVNDSVPAVPSAPTGLTYLALTNAPKYDMSCWIQLSWNAVTGATYYNIQRNGVWLAIGVPTNGFTDYHVPFTGSAFTYTIVPVNAGGSGSGTSITAYSLTGFPVTLTAATNGPGSVTLTCAWSTNAPTYNVYRASVSGGPYAFIGSTGLTTNLASTPATFFGIFTDTNAPGGTNYYVMTAYDGITESLYSPAASAVVTGVAPVVSTNAYLASLVVNPTLTFMPTFASNVPNYAATEAYGSVPTVTVTNADLTATNQLIYNGVTNIMASGVASAPLALNPNPAATNVVTVRVTAQDGVTVINYQVYLTQLPNQTSRPGLTNSVNNGMLNLNWGLDRLGYRLLVQTNNLNLGVSGNPADWGTVPGSTVSNSITLPIVKTNLNSYYRLVYP